MRQLQSRSAFAQEGVEVTVEANPESATLEKLQCYREHGANRISIGVQSFQSSYLKMFDRVHSVEQVYLAIENARSAGFTRINIDLIFSKPNESLELWKSDLIQALKLQVDHISCYELMFEEGTTFHRELVLGKVAPCEEEERLQQYHWTIAELSKHHYEPYEISAFAQPNSQCRHNIVYWTSGEWIGVGAGAGTSLANENFLNVKNPDVYTAAINNTDSARDLPTQEFSNPRTRLSEVLLMGLRLRAGIPLSLVSKRTGLDLLKSCSRQVEFLGENGLITIADGWIALTERGRDVASVVMRAFLEDGAGK